MKIIKTGDGRIYVKKRGKLYFLMDKYMSEVKSIPTPVNKE